MTTENGVTGGPVERTVNRNLLRYAVQRAIFCPRCQRILDMRRAVLLIFWKESEAKELCVCRPCYGQGRERLKAKAAERNVRIEVIDGRTKRREK